MEDGNCVAEIDDGGLAGEDLYSDVLDGIHRAQAETAAGCETIRP
jgi:hypothetical protein